MLLSNGQHKLGEGQLLIKRGRKRRGCIVLGTILVLTGFR